MLRFSPANLGESRLPSVSIVVLLFSPVMTAASTFPGSASELFSRNPCSAVFLSGRLIALLTKSDVASEAPTVVTLEAHRRPVETTLLVLLGDLSLPKSTWFRTSHTYFNSHEYHKLQCDSMESNTPCAFGALTCSGDFLPMISRAQIFPLAWDVIRYCAAHKLEYGGTTLSDVQRNILA